MNQLPERAPVERVLVDDQGQAHAYKVVLHPAGAAIALMRKLMKLVGGSAAQGVASLTTLDLGKLLDGSATVDGKAFAGAIDRFADLVAEYGDAAIFKEVLKWTTRDELAVDAFFDRIYQGNLGELMRAVFFALEANFGPLLKGALGQISALIPAAPPPGPPTLRAV